MRRLALTTLAVTALALAGCGKGPVEPPDDKPGPDRTQEDEHGGSIRVGYAAFPDALDPATAYTVDAWQALWAVYTPLLTYRHAEGREGSELVPGLAEGLPRISGDGRTYRLRLRKGLRYSDGRPVRAADFEHTVKRVLRLRSAGTSFFAAVAGAEAYRAARRDAGDIRGIRSDERSREITIRLTRRDGRFPRILASEFVGLVPGDTPFEDLTDTPPPGVGPYRIAAVRPGRGFALNRVAGFDAGDLPKGRLDRLTVDVVQSPRRLVQAVVANRVDITGVAPPPDTLSDLRDRLAGKRYREEVGTASTFFFLNHDVAPFDDPRVRRAVNLAVDREDVARRFGGLLEPGCNLLPPAVPGAEELDPCPYAEPDQDRARELLRRSGAAGAEVLVHASDLPEERAAAQELAAALRRIGLKARARIVQDAQYPGVAADRAGRVQAGLTTWYQDLAHPASFLQLVDGRSIRPRLGLNAGFVDDPALNRILARAGAEADLDEAQDAYAAADRRVITQAHIVPLGFRRSTVLASERMDSGEDCTVLHPVYGIDFASLCLD